ncbi:MAG TPA: tetratricopeptide repeat protein [Planctomycetaceae bacterium]|nr:tetratricopeptide repeat protein [Planctomycetaceae bacterium]
MLATLALFAAPLLIYAQVWGFGFICLDDSAYVTANGYVQEGITLHGLVWSFTAVHDANWIPLTWISLMLDTDIYGVRAGGYHLTNALMHATNTVLLFWALSRATKNWARTAFVAALFALHPLHVESVAWVAERKDVLSTFLGLLSLLWYVRYATGGRRWNLVAAVLALAASLLAKQTLVTLPFVFLLLDFWPLGRWSATSSPVETAKPARTRRETQPVAGPQSSLPPSFWRRPGVRLVGEKIPFFAASAIFSFLALWAQSRSGAVTGLGYMSLTERCMNAVVVYVAYLQKTLLPLDLAVYYPHPHENLSWVALGIAAALLIAISVAAVVWIRRFPFVFVGWCWYLGTLVPMIGLVQIGSQQMADRYTYFPLIGIFLAATWLVPELVPAGVLRTRVLPAAALAGLLLLAGTTYGQIAYWHDSLSLLRHAMACTPDSATIHEFLGGAEVSEGDANEAVKELQKAIQLAPKYAPVHVNLGTAYQQLGRFDEAVQQYREAIALGDRSREMFVDLGVILFNRGQVEEAKAQYQQALESDPTFLPALINLSIACLSTADYGGAIAHGERALQIDPNLANAHVCIATALRGQHRFDEAIRHFQMANELQPNDPAVLNELARTQSMKQNPSGQ